MKFDQHGVCSCYLNHEINGYGNVVLTWLASFSLYFSMMYMRISMKFSRFRVQAVSNDECLMSMTVLAITHLFGRNESGVGFSHVRRLEHGSLWRAAAGFGEHHSGRWLARQAMKKAFLHCVMRSTAAIATFPPF